MSFSGWSGRPPGERAMCGGERAPKGAARRHGGLDAPHADPDRGADFDKLEANGGARRLGELGVLESDAAKRAERHIGHGSKPQAQPVGSEGCRRGAIGEEIAPAFLDAVLPRRRPGSPRAQ